MLEPRALVDGHQTYGEGINLGAFAALLLCLLLVASCPRSWAAGTCLPQVASIPSARDGGCQEPKHKNGESRKMMQVARNLHLQKPYLAFHCTLPHLPVPPVRPAGVLVDGEPGSCLPSSCKLPWLSPSGRVGHAGHRAPGSGCAFPFWPAQ